MRIELPGADGYRAGPEKLEPQSAQLTALCGNEAELDGEWDTGTSAGAKNVLGCEDDGGQKDNGMSLSSPPECLTRPRARGITDGMIYDV